MSPGDFPPLTALAQIDASPEVPRTLSAQIPSLLPAIENAFAVLPASHQQILLSSLKDPKYYDDMFSASVAALVEKSPELKAFTAQGVKESEAYHAAVGPLLFWALTQGWSTPVSAEKMKSYLSTWSSSLRAGKYSSNPMAAGFAAGIAMALLDTRLEMSTAKKMKFRAQVFASIHAMADYPGLANWSTALTHPLLINLGLLAESCGQEMLHDKFVVAHWEDTVRKTILKMKDPGKEAFYGAVLNSPLSKNYKLRACMQSEGPLWLMPSLSSSIAPLLPTNERARFTQLNWKVGNSMSGKAEAEFNYRLVQTYCPDMHQLLDLAVAPEEWGSQKKLTKRVQEFHTHATTLVLPTDMEFGW